MSVTVTFYAVTYQNAVEGEEAFPTLAQARTARAQCEPGEGAIRKLVAQADSMRELACALFNRQGFAVEQTEIVGDKPASKELEP